MSSGDSTVRAADGISPAGVDVATVPTAVYHPMEHRAFSVQPQLPPGPGPQPADRALGGVAGPVWHLRTRADRCLPAPQLTVLGAGPEEDTGRGGEVLSRWSAAPSWEEVFGRV